MKNNSPTLLILAAGMASRYGSLKQIEGFGPNGETLMEYSIYDAIQAGFNKVVFIIREEFSENFKANFDHKLKNKIEVEYVYQTFDLEKYNIPHKIQREKPWGTGHAILEANKVIDSPFCMINADDFYGNHAFKLMFDFLNTKINENIYSLVAYSLSKTLSKEGTVSRGICKVSAQNTLLHIEEKLKIKRDPNGIIVNEDDKSTLEDDQLASMNFFGFHPSLFKILKNKFPEFVEKNKDNLKSEFLIPTVLQESISANHIEMKVMKSQSQWFGVTYPKDSEIVKQELLKMVDLGFYPNKLWD